MVKRGSTTRNYTSDTNVNTGEGTASGVATRCWCLGIADLTYGWISALLSALGGGWWHSTYTRWLVEDRWLAKSGRVRRWPDGGQSTWWASMLVKVIEGRLVTRSQLEGCRTTMPLIAGMCWASHTVKLSAFTRRLCDEKNTGCVPGECVERLLTKGSWVTQWVRSPGDCVMRTIHQRALAWRTKVYPDWVWQFKWRLERGETKVRPLSVWSDAWMISRISAWTMLMSELLGGFWRLKRDESVGNKGPPW